MLLYGAFVLVLAVGYAAGRWRAHAEVDEALSQAAEIGEVLLDALLAAPGVCDEYADEQAARDNGEDPPSEAILKEPWVQSIEAACVTLGAQDCGMLVTRHMEAALKRVKEIRGV